MEIPPRHPNTVVITSERFEELVMIENRYKLLKKQVENGEKKFSRS